jgi:hypothetical protein
VDWRAVIRATMDERGGLATRQQLLERMPREVLDSHVGRSNLIRVFPRVYRLRTSGDDDVTALRAALLHAGPAAALSHTTALALWGVRPLERPLHLTVNQSIKRAGAPGLVVHRRLRFDPESAQCVARRGFRVTDLPRSVVDSWPLLPTGERRPLALDVVRRGLTTAALLRTALQERPNVAGHRTLHQAIELVADGCRSELARCPAWGSTGWSSPSAASSWTGAGPRPSWRSSSTAPSTTRHPRIGGGTSLAIGRSPPRDGSFCGSPTRTCCASPRVSAHG